MRILAIDYGTRRVGLALCDPGGFLATPFVTLNHDSDEASLVVKLLRVVQEQRVERVVLGWPIRGDGSPGTHAPAILTLAHALAASSPVPVTLHDEAFTTAEAWERIRSSGKKRRDPRADRQKVDQVAAALLLEAYLREVPEPLRPLPPLPAKSEPIPPDSHLPDPQP